MLSRAFCWLILVIGLSPLTMQALGQVSLPASASSKNHIQVENEKPGSRDWQLTRVRVDSSRYRSPWIEGYCSKQSVKAGESITLFVSTKPARKFKVEFFRTGYYGGKGARLMLTTDPLLGGEQQTPSPGEKDLHECRWKPSYELTIPKDWTSGVYLVA